MWLPISIVVIVVVAALLAALLLAQSRRPGGVIAGVGRPAAGSRWGRGA
jgi:hypothetical protein